MIDPDVNLSIIREADGIVSNLDCHNISLYENDNNLLFYIERWRDGLFTKKRETSQDRRNIMTKVSGLLKDGNIDMKEFKGDI